MALANAMPAEKYGWRPGEGVRSVGEVFNHVASANYFFPTLWGGTVPAGIDPQSLEKAMSGDKAKTIDTLKKSFDNVRAGDPGGPRGRPEPADQDLRPRRHRPRRHDDRRHPRPRAPRPVDRLRPLERRRAALERQGGLRTRKVRSPPRPVLSGSPPPDLCRGRGGRNASSMPAGIASSPCSLVPRSEVGGGLGEAAGAADGSGGGAYPSRSRNTLSIATRSASRRPSLPISSAADLDRPVEVDVVDHRGLPDLLLGVPVPCRSPTRSQPVGR